MIRRGRHQRNFTILPNKIFEDERLCIAAKGMLGFLISRPPSWEVRHRQLRDQLGMGRDLFSRVMGELIAAGYVRRSPEQKRTAEAKTFLAYDYEVFDSPQSDGEAAAGNPSTASRCRKPDSGSKKDNNNTNIQIEDPEFPYAEAAIAAEQQGLPRQAENTKIEKASPAAIKRHSERPEVIHARIAERLGSIGWSIVQWVTPSELDQLTAQERRGCLGERVLAELRLRFNTRSLTEGDLDARVAP